MTVDYATAPDGTRVPLVGVGTSVIHDLPSVRVWDVTLAPGATHPWHLHRNPYVVLSVQGSTGRMDWLDASPSRDIEEYTGGAVFRPVSPVHRLTNTGPAQYRNHLVELKALGENRPDGPLDVGPGARSVEGERPAGASQEPDGRNAVLLTDFVRVWTISVAAESEVSLQLSEVDHLLAEIDGSLHGPELSDSVFTSPGGPLTLSNPRSIERTWFVLALDYSTRT